MLFSKFAQSENNHLPSIASEIDSLPAVHLKVVSEKQIALFVGQAECPLEIREDTQYQARSVPKLLPTKEGPSGGGSMDSPNEC